MQMPGVNGISFRFPCSTGMAKAPMDFITEMMILSFMRLENRKEGHPNVMLPHKNKQLLRGQYTQILPTMEKRVWDME